MFLVGGRGETAPHRLHWVEASSCRPGTESWPCYQPPAPTSPPTQPWRCAPSRSRPRLPAVCLCLTVEQPTRPRCPEPIALDSGLQACLPDETSSDQIQSGHSPGRARRPPSGRKATLGWRSFVLSARHTTTPASTSPSGPMRQRACRTGLQGCAPGMARLRPRSAVVAVAAARL